MVKPLDILFINPPSAFKAYNDSKVKVFKQIFPLLSFMSLSAILKQNGFTTSLLDLGIEKNPWEVFKKVLAKTKPRFIGITSTTPLFFEVVEISKLSREISKDIKIIYGGPHATALPEESLSQSEIDIVVTGEGEIPLKEIMQGKKLSSIGGIYYKKNGKILKSSALRKQIDINELPLPDIMLYDIKKYHCSKLVSKGTPVLHMETSRGCPHDCKFCNKNIFGKQFRAKSPEKVIKEMKYFIEHGAGEFRIIDDQFAADLSRAKKICKLMIKENIKIPWNLGAGVRVDVVDQEFLNLAKMAGCYQLGVGFESGNQRALDSISKGIKIEQSIRSMKMIKKSGLESIGFFIIGLPADTVKSMNQTIKFAKKLMPTYAKTTILMPFPGTELFKEYEKKGLIKTKNWSKYNIHLATEVYQHPTLTSNQLKKYYDKFYRSFYLSPRFIYSRIIKSLKEGTLMRDISYGVKTFLQ